MANNEAILTRNRELARNLGLIMFGLGFVLLMDAYRGRETPKLVRLVHPLA